MNWLKAIFTMQRVGWLWAANSIGLMLFWQHTDDERLAVASVVCFIVAVLLWALGSNDI